MAAALPRVLIVVLNYNGKDLLGPCLRSIREHTAYANYRVVVADNASPDGSLAIVESEFPWAEAVQNGANLGFAKGNNAILATRDADYYLLLNNDTEVTPGWLEALLREAEADPAVGLVGAKLLFPDGRIQHAGCIVEPREPRHLGYLAPGNTHNEPRDVDYVTFAAVLIKREVVEAIGFLDEGYAPMYYEDVDYCLRARAAGFRVRYAPASVIVHHEGTGSKRQPSKQRVLIAERNRIRFKLIHYSLGLWLRGGLLFELKKFYWNGRDGFLAESFKAWGQNLRQLGEVLRRRRQRAGFLPSAFSAAASPRTR